MVRPADSAGPALGPMGWFTFRPVDGRFSFSFPTTLSIFCGAAAGVGDGVGGPAAAAAQPAPGAISCGFSFVSSLQSLLWGCCRRRWRRLRPSRRSSTACLHLVRFALSSRFVHSLNLFRGCGRRRRRRRACCSSCTACTWCVWRVLHLGHCKGHKNASSAAIPTCPASMSLRDWCLGHHCFIILTASAQR